MKTKEQIATWLKSANPESENHRQALSRALLFLYARQTSDEQAFGTTSHNNSKGFSRVDSEFLSSVAKSTQKYGRMSPKQAIWVAKKLVKYSGQLTEMTSQAQAIA